MFSVKAYKRNGNNSTISHLSKSLTLSGQLHTLTILSLGKETLKLTDWRWCASDCLFAYRNNFYSCQEKNDGLSSL
jgi:hypothetical protein